MKARDDGSSEFRKCVTWHASKIALGGLLAILMMASLLTSMSFLGSGCSPPPPSATPTCTPMIVTRQPSPTSTDSPAPTASSTSTPTLFPPVILKEPDNGSCLACQSDFTLRWSCPYTLQPEMCYWLGVKELNSPIYISESYQVQNHAKPPDLSPGRYEWAVTVVSSTNHVAVSRESAWYSFDIVPRPVVHGISPTGTVQGDSVPVTITGENFMSPITLTIGESLQATVVDSSTITATIPITLPAGVYPVILEGSTGKVISFTVEYPPPPKPTVVHPTTPPDYPPPVLEGFDIIGCCVKFKWGWARTLADDEWFAVRVGRADEDPESRVWIKEREHTYCIGDHPGDYSWQIAVCQGPDPSYAYCPDPLAISERGTFRFNGSHKER